MKNISDFFVRISNWKTLLLFFIIYLCFNLYFLPKVFKGMVPEEDKNLPILDLQFGYNPERVKEIVSMYTGEAKEAYIFNCAVVDGIYPVVYMFFFAIIFSLVFYKWKINPWFKYMNLFSFIILVFDYLENYHIVKMLKTYPENIDNLAVNCSAITLLKWVFAGIALLMILVGILQNLLRKSN
jgi:hypothetical protein